MVGFVKDIEKIKETPCSKCEKPTISKRLGRAHYHCEECDHDKSLSDVYYFEATQATISGKVSE